MLQSFALRLRPLLLRRLSRLLRIFLRLLRLCMLGLRLRLGVCELLLCVGDRLIGPTNTMVAVFGGLTLIGIAAIVWVALRAARPRS